MNKENNKTIPEATVDIYAVLSPFTSEERNRIIKATLAMLGDDNTGVMPNYKGNEPQGYDVPNSTNSYVKLPTRASSWLKQNSISYDDLEKVFFLGENGDIELIANDLPVKSNKEKTQYVYILCGIMQLLQDGNLTFADSLARTACSNFGCYDGTNHSKYLNNIGNSLVGDKNKGWTLTAPGQKRAAEIVKELIGKAGG